MNILEISKKLNIILNELADTSKDLKELIRSWTPNIFEHIYKIQQYGDLYPKTKHHWASEIVGSMAKFCFKKLKYNNAQMSDDYIYKAMISKYIDSDEIIDIIYSCINQYKCIKLQDINIDESYNRITNVLPPLINYCKNNRKMDLDEIIRIIEV